MLILRPNCELCDKDLPADSTEAMICTYECTFCEFCVKNVLQNVCPNCGGGFCRRPIRPDQAHRERVSLVHQPASTQRVHTPYTVEQIKAFSQSVKNKHAN